MQPAALSRTARCACSETSLTVSGEPVFHNVCHCTNCKRRTGSAFGVSAYFKRSQVLEQVGTTRVYALHNPHQNHEQERHFCSHCGTTLFWHLSSLPELVGIAGGCFAEDELGAPQASFTHAKKWAWVELPADWKTVHE